MKINRYPDGTKYITLEDNEPEERIWRLNEYEDLWLLNHYVDVYNFKFSKKPTLILPFLIDGQADRRFGQNESSGLKLVLEFLKNLKANFRIYHPHNPEVVEAYLPNAKLIDCSQFLMEILVNDFEYGMLEDPKNNFVPKYKNLIIMSPDAGAFKWVTNICNKIGWKEEVVSASKYRPKYDSAEVGKIKLKQQLPNFDFKGKDVLILDDICIYGGTFKGLSSLLQKEECKDLYLATSHIALQFWGKKSDNLVTKYFTKMYTTNSKYKEVHCDSDWGTLQDGPENLEILKIF